ncbi:hypothetical protein RJ639_040312 [Escallonia herrerae]|uniref:Transposase (putative) gypsy type domain-containing protein n=1 Tax=Escallonia herrerae TaxID=1293975 RepID=A0AA89B5G8_9ASTE|nr:hypothetical protein RJ639_040312 [Escallonia herrerae]
MRHSVPVEFLGTILLVQNDARPKGILLGQSALTGFYLCRILFGSLLPVMLLSGKAVKFQTLLLLACDTSETLTSSEENTVVCRSSSLSSEWVPTSGSEVGTSNPQLPQPLTSQPQPPSSSQLSHSLPAKNALGDVKDQAKDKANPKPRYTTDEKSSKMSSEDLLELIREYPLPEGRYASLLGLQEPANYGTKFETGIYEEQVKSVYRLPLHPFALRFFEHYHMAPGQLVPNGWRKLAGLIYLVQTSGYKPDATDFMRVLSIDEPLSEQQLEWTMIIPRKSVPAGALIPPPPATSTESVPLEMASRSGKSPQRGFLGVLQKAKGKRKSSQVAAEEAQQKWDAVKEVEEVTRRAEELSKQEADYLARVETLERRLKRVKRKVEEEVKTARDQGISNFLDRNAGKEWLKKRTDDGLEIYEMGFMKAKELFA